MQFANRPHFAILGCLFCYSPFATTMAAEYPNAPAYYNIIQRVMKNSVMKRELGVMMQNETVKSRITETMESMRNGR